MGRRTPKESLGLPGWDSIQVPIARQAETKTTVLSALIFSLGADEPLTRHFIIPAQAVRSTQHFFFASFPHVDSGVFSSGSRHWNHDLSRVIPATGSSWSSSGSTTLALGKRDAGDLLLALVAIPL